MSMQVTKVWWDGEKLMAEPINESEVYKPAAWVYPEFFENIERAGCWTAYAKDGNGQNPDGVVRFPLYRGPQPLTGGDDRRHIICLCPDCTRPKPADEPVALEIIRKWPDGFQERLQHVWLDVVSFIPNVKLYDLQRVLAEFGFTMLVYEGTRSQPAAQLPDPVHEYRKGFIAGQIDMRDRPEEQPAAPAIPMELRCVQETVKEGGGFWRSCTGCHELNEGHDTGPFSEIFGCALGNGCSECGGIGAVWDDTDYEDMARAMLAAQLSHPNPENTAESSADAEIASHAKRLALELECLLLSCGDTAAVTKWWDSAHEALEKYRAAIDRLYPPEHPTFMGEPVVAKGGAA